MMMFRTLLTLLVMAELTIIGATPHPLAYANNLQALVQTATIPMLPGTAQPISRLQGNQTNPHDFDVWGFTFQLNDSIYDQLNDLMALVRSFNLQDGTEASLLSKSQEALAAVNTSDTTTACDSLSVFINASQAHVNKKLTADQVKQLVDFATQIKSDLGCQQSQLEKETLQ
jgi:hypothetical protein